ncbi:MAG: hypothetical protein V4555_09595, partial [Acidobacteriota bacterium]
MLRRIAAGLMLCLCALASRAGGPRFVTGYGFTSWYPGAVMAFYTVSPRYYTDPGVLNSSVTHAQADAMVAAAAAVWNVPTASITLAQGGTLSEHVSTGDTSFNATGVAFPADVQASNYLAKPIAIVYDTDGGITDMLLGDGASDPGSCRQHGVTESVDGFGATGTIQHAVILLNGRCVGSNPQQLMQMQYQLMRAFGRVLGLAWSQVNDNVFTGVPAPTANNESYWPVMHPIDVICGPYTYQCMQNPFQLRIDDVAALALLYPVTPSNVVPGKTISLTGAVSMVGEIDFPNGDGMDMVNVTVSRLMYGSSSPDSSMVASGISGIYFAQNFGNPISGAPTASEDVGNRSTALPGRYAIGAFPLGSGGNLFVHTEAINPLYTGQYALGTYERPAATPSGSPQMQIGQSEWVGYQYNFVIPIPDAASTCTLGNDGSRLAPAATDSSGWWTGLICSAQHTSWW